MFSEEVYFKYLDTKYLGRGFEHIDTVTSTNDYLMHCGGEPGRTVVADEQTKGRGRTGRVWQTYGGALAFSVILPNVEISKLMPLHLLAGYAVTDALRAYAPVGLKWPNDCVINGKKAVGMLLESVFSGNELKRVVLGVGVNICKNITNNDMAVSIGDYYSGEIEREKLLAQILNRLEALLGCSNDIAAIWQNYSANYMKKITIHRNNELIECKELGINDDGCLIAELADGRTDIITSGEIGYDFSS